MWSPLQEADLPRELQSIVHLQCHDPVESLYYSADYEDIIYATAYKKCQLIIDQSTSDNVKIVLYFTLTLKAYSVVMCDMWFV